MNKTLGLLSIILALAATPIRAQEPAIEYGSPSELAGVRTIFIHTGGDLKAHNKIAEYILKKLPGLRLANRPLDADVVLGFAQGSDSYLKSVLTSGRSSGNLTVQDSPVGIRGTYHGSASSTSTPVYRSVKTGTGLVAKLKAGTASNPQPAIRLLMDFSDSKSRRLFEREPYTNFARAFLSAYEKANK